jgi:mRNA interferase MazF
MVVRVHKLATLEKRLVERRLGVLAASDWAQVQAKIQQLWASIQVAGSVDNEDRPQL